ncbi:MAG: 23S rRNA (uracil(1939)-C(5))-methyltransferase RlmD [Bacteroidetes bacterium HGW-Bacteroidetes-21]|jgi:23S rRNA (uracil1939-C5)-methyltransferase|nr:MAG: 23S rRNA (uracil(1939)-C(5))-methyltransferase RlmD [Bacteroidetes bacterium HGW-Bacteroidetes-21]
MSRKTRDITAEHVEITSYAAEGKAFGKINNKIVFVPYAVPGDIVDLQITRNKSSFMEGRITRIITPSADRITPICAHFGICGGCRWQHLPYNKQLQYKQQQVVDQLKHIGGIETESLQPIIPSEKTTEYRNKLEFTFSPRGWMTREELDSGMEFGPALGFHLPGKFDKVVDVVKCWLQEEISNKIRIAVKDFAIKHQLPFHNLVNHEGLMRTMTIRIATTGEIMVIIVMREEADDAMEALAASLQSDFKEITSLIFFINGKANDSFDFLSPYKIYGSEFITEKLDHLNFRIGPLSFFQTNSRQAVNMYRMIRELGELKSSDVVYDLYSGTGTISNYLAPFVSKVVGVEYVQESVDHAGINSKLNSIHNTTFVAGDMKDILNEAFFTKHGKPDVLVTDPPRAGMHGDVVNILLNSGVAKIIYISCNPATQARDLKILSAAYKTILLQPIDMFPHTHHVENIALLTRY